MTSLIETIKIKKGQKVAQLIVSNIRNIKGFGEMDEINFSK